ncbi:hypothetical protein Krac_7479 [Ktedonobacter racemifer DSM 44963]|uniref:Uncharacterized protein n=1 Tax=Ktedonobacter racemifer DSM 44963 TaxID=485913 RepID=D6TK90_KTERA|nr:hypothetical protein Krac_7479 [Ktedonobacter racemifer DSM 44963]
MLWCCCLRDAPQHTTLENAAGMRPHARDSLPFMTCKRKSKGGSGVFRLPQTLDKQHGSASSAPHTSHSIGKMPEEFSLQQVAYSFPFTSHCPGCAAGPHGRKHADDAALLREHDYVLLEGRFGLKISFVGGPDDCNTGPGKCRKWEVRCHLMETEFLRACC